MDKPNPIPLPLRTNPGLVYFRKAIDRRAGVLNIKFHKETRVDAEKLMNLISSTPDAQFTRAGVMRVPTDGAVNPEEVLAFMRDKLMEPLGAMA